MREALKALVKEVCDTCSGQDMPMRQWIRITRNDDRSMLWPIELRPHHLALQVKLDRIRDQIQSLNEIVRIVENDAALAAAFLVDDTGLPLANSVVGRTWISGSLTNPFLLQYFDIKRDFVFDPEIVDALADQLPKSIHPPTLSLVCPLLNATLEAETVQITPFMKLRKLTTDELEDWLNFFPYPTIINLPLAPEEIVRLECAVEITGVAPTGASSEGEALRKLVNILRLLTGANIYIPFKQEERHGPGTSPFGNTSLSWAGPSLLLYDRKVTIDQPTTERLTDLWHRLENDAAQNIRRTALALNRLSSTAERTFDDDMLIDYWIGLESLFLPDSNQELSLRAALRIAAFLGKTPNERQKIFTDVSHSYDWRSTIVHGSTMSKKKMKKGTLRETAMRTRGYLRDAILQIIESDTEFKPDDIEVGLLRGEFPS